MEAFTEYIFSLEPFLIYLFMIFIAWIENIFPPVPSDLLIVFTGSLVTSNKISLIPSILFTTLGSSLGFLTMYMIGNKFGAVIVNNQYYKFISAEALNKIESWFIKHGLSIIILNRFLSGTRAFISFAAGFMHLHLPTTILFATISSLLWNSILIYFGYSLGSQWQIIGMYLSTYGQFVTGILLFVLVIYWAWKIFYKNKNNA